MTALPVHVCANIWVGINTKTGVVTPSYLEISKHGMHEVEWFCMEKDQSATVTFANRPFYAQKFRYTERRGQIPLSDRSRRRRLAQIRNRIDPHHQAIGDWLHKKRRTGEKPVLLELLLLARS